MAAGKQQLVRTFSLVSLLFYIPQQRVAALSSGFVRPGKSYDLPLLSESLRRSDSASRPEQIHISFAGPGAVSVSWVTYSQDVLTVAQQPEPHLEAGQLSSLGQTVWSAVRSLAPPSWSRKFNYDCQLSDILQRLQQTAIWQAVQRALQRPTTSGSAAEEQQPQGRQQSQLGKHKKHHKHHSKPAEPDCDHLSHLQITTFAVYGTSATLLTDDGQVANGAFAVNGSHNCYTSAEYESGALHSVILGQGPEGPLLPSTTYYYRVGDPGAGGELSAVYSFNTTPPIGPESFPYRLGLVGDLGQTLDSAKTLQHLVDVRPQSILNVGDLSYADGYQPRWDTYGRMIQPSTSQVSWMNIEGNHEQELVGEDEKSWLAYLLRFSATDEASGSGTTMYYSYDVAAAHVIMIGSYADFDADSAQYAWLEQDLQKVDRSRTPWLIAGMHVPWYNSYHSHHGEGDDICDALEGLLFQYGVDLVFAGHVHSYERSKHVFRGEPNPCGPIHITIGDGGNREGAAIGWEEPQPEWSEVREPSFGMGVLEFLDTQTAVWHWYRNNQTAIRDVADEVILLRDPTCHS